VAVGTVKGAANRDLNQTRVLPKKSEKSNSKLHNEDGTSLSQYALQSFSIFVLRY
jgi:hypothetical protein